MTKDFRYAAGGASPSPTVLQRRTLLWVGKPLGAPARICARTVGSANPGAGVKPHQRQFLQTQGPVARNETMKATQILRAENYLPSPRGNPRNGGPGVRRLWARSVHRSRPPAILWFLSHRWERNSPPAGGETPLRKQYLKGGAPRSSRPTQKTALPSPPHPALRATFPPRGRLFGGIISSSVWPSASHLSPGGRLIRRAGGKM